MKDVMTETNTHPEKERGQSLVLIALSMIGVLAFVGLAVDVGLVFARSTQLQAAVDAAALAGVTELTDGISAANTKAGQFLNSNGVPPDAISTFQSATDSTELDATTYTLTVTWPVELFFLRLIDRDVVNLTKAATAAYFPLADIYASRRVDNGAVSTSNQAVFGPNSCTQNGDPFTPLNSPWAPGPFTYNYRILIPSDYPSSKVRVELFDPDSINTDGRTLTMQFSSAAQAIDPANYPSGDVTITETSGTYCQDKQTEPCLIRAEFDLYTSGKATLDQINPFWFKRIDENRNSCSTPGSYKPEVNTATLFQLFYYRENPDGTVEKINLSNYTGQPYTDAHDTDMRWVSPGAPLSWDQTTAVPVDAGSAKTFELDIYQDLPNILVDPSTGNRYIYLDVTSISGSSENGFELWAGPPDYVATVPSDVNARNLYMLENPNSHFSYGVTVFGLGQLPMNSNITNRVEIPLVYIGPEYAGQTAIVEGFDQDSGAQYPVVFYFDTIPRADWEKSYGTPGKQITNQNSWETYSFTIPNDENCDYNNPTEDTCTPFYGGRLMVSYAGGSHDTYGWQIRLTGLPYLIR